MKIVSVKAELAVLRGMCSKDKKIAGTLLQNVDSSYFHTPESVELFESLHRYISDNGESPTYRLLLEDPELSDEARAHMRESVATIQTTKDAEKASRILDNYRKKRALADLAETITREFSGSKMDVEDVMHNASEALSKMRTKKTSDSSFTHFGKNSNAEKLVKSILYDDNSEQIIPTGIHAFDSISGGISRGSLFTVGANSGGGKSVMASQLAVNFANMGYKVLLVPLEMSRWEMTARIMANVTKTDLTNILTQKLSTNDKDLVYNKFKRWNKKVKVKGGRYTIFKPESDMTIEEIMASISAFNTDVVIIDYISLLRGVDGEDQWRALGAVARYAKINAENMNRVNILLCQVSDEGKIRYAGAIKEHCVTGDTLIDTANGLMRIDSLYPEASCMSTKKLTNILVKSEGRYREASHVHYNGVREIYEVVLKNGLSIRSTSQHRYRMLGTDSKERPNNLLKVSWQKLKDLRVGDTIAIDSGKSLFSKKQITIDIPKPETHHNSKIVSIKKIGEEKVYDLTVPGTENYVANGIIVHNSSASWLWVTTKESKEVGINLIEQIKSRNSKAFPFRVKVQWELMRVKDAPMDESLGADPSEEEDTKGKKKRKDRGLPNLSMDGPDV